MLQIQATSEFEADFRRMARSGKDTTLFWELVSLLAEQKNIPTEYRDHELSGRWRGVRDIHIESDWLLLYQITENELILVRTGSHEELF